MDLICGDLGFRGLIVIGFVLRVGIFMKTLGWKFWIFWDLL